MKKIIRLPETVINQIAAGEVVENPASVIKELIENSLDANARNICIRIQKGGQDLIEIEDDGDGMSAEDALACLERHATSKIRSAEDLLQLSTMGFRGEALAAIASVSHFEIKTSNDQEATKICGEGGNVEEVIPCARNRGTSVTIRSLFFNVPARKKFQKSVASSTAQVTKVVEIMSMANPEVAFSYVSQDETIYSLDAQPTKERIETLLGPFEYQSENAKFWGLFGAPTQAKSQRRKQHLFVNKRPVFSPLIAKAVQMAYGTRLEKNTYPAFTLFLELDASTFDINVHPQKKEVRFSNESSLFSQVGSFVSKMLAPKESIARKPIFFDQPPSFLLADVPSRIKEEHQSPLPFELKGRPLAVFGPYLLMEKEGLFLINLQGARARIFFEELKEKKVQSQSLLFPIEIEETDPEVISSLQSIGIECRQIARKMIAIDSLPQEIDPQEFDSFFDAWKEGKNLDSLSVRFCRRSKKNYSLEDAMHLWETLQKCADSVFDPLGKRLWRKVESGDLDQWLGS